jgi:hypothetical protein
MYGIVKMKPFHSKSFKDNLIRFKIDEQSKI